jgi:hypothetical protein
MPPSPREFEKAAAQRASDAERVGHRASIQPQEASGCNRGAERPRRARRVKAAGFVRVAGRAADPDHNLVAGDKGGNQRPAIGALFLRDRKGGRQHGCARMGAGTGAGQAVELEGVRERAVGKRRRRRLNGRAAAENVALAAGPGALCIIDDDAAPRHRRAADRRRDRVDDAVFRPLHDQRRQIFVAKRGGIFGEPDGFLCHVILLRRKLASRRIKPWKRSGAKSSTLSSSGRATRRHARRCRRARTAPVC